MHRVAHFAFYFSGGAHDHAARGNNGAFRDERASGDDAARANHCAIQNNGAHADQAEGLDGAAVQGHGMADGNFVADMQRPFIAHDVQDGPVLNIRAGADADQIHISADDTQRPDAGVFANVHVADDHRRAIDVCGGRDGRPDSAKGADVCFVIQRFSFPGPGWLALYC
jgi:hypothetical protein